MAYGYGKCGKGATTAATLAAILCGLLLGCGLVGCGESETPAPTPGGDPNMDVDAGMTPTDNPPDGGDVEEDDAGVLCVADDDLGSALGSAVATGSTAGATNDTTPYCTYGSNAPDMAFTWTAPEAGIYAMDTLGSDFDTVLAVYQATCVGKAIACNDEVRPKKKTSLLRVQLDKGQVVVIVVDGYRASEGNFILNIDNEPPTAEAGQCADTFDNDRDGDTDCEDWECNDDPACTQP